MKRPLVLLCTLGLLIGAWMATSFWGCASKQDADRIAQALADRLSDALDFSDSSPTENPSDTLPDDNPGNLAFPQVTALAAPGGLRPGEAFTLQIQTNFDPNDVGGAVVQVTNAGTYLDFPVGNLGGINSSGVIQIPGRLREVDYVNGDPNDPVQWVEGRAFKLKVAMRSQGMAGQPGIGNFRNWQIAVADTEEDLSISHLCNDICNFLERCGAEFGGSSQTEQPADGEGDFARIFRATENSECLSICRSEETMVKRGSSKACWDTVVGYVQCLFNLPCEEYAATTGDWYEQGESSCRYFAERMQTSCQDADWYQDAFGDGGFDDLVCEGACSVLVASGCESDMQMCKDYVCENESRSMLECIASSSPGECFMLFEQCRQGGDSDLDLDIDTDTDTDVDTGEDTFCQAACVRLVNCGQESDQTTCEETGCPFYSAAALECAALIAETDCESLTICLER